MVAIGGDFLDHQAVAGGFALQPELVARAAVEGGEAGFHGLAEGFFVHEADHQNAAGGVVLNDGGDQAVDFLKSRFIVRVNKKARRNCRGLDCSDEESDP